MTRVRLSRIFWIGAAAILVAAALVALVAVLRGDFSDTDGRILGTLAAALLAGSTLVAGLVLTEKGGRVLGWSAVVVAVPAFAAITYSIWAFVFDGEGDVWQWGWAGILALLAALDRRDRHGCSRDRALSFASRGSRGRWRPSPLPSRTSRSRATTPARGSVGSSLSCGSSPGSPTCSSRCCSASRQPERHQAANARSRSSTESRSSRHGRATDSRSSCGQGNGSCYEGTASPAPIGSSHNL